MHQISGFLPFILILLVFWLFIIRPQRRRQAEARALQKAAQPGTEVVLTSGIFGTIKERADDHVVIEIADGVTIKVVPAAIGHTVRPQETVEPDETDETDGTDGAGTAITLDKTDTPDAPGAPASEEN